MEWLVLITVLIYNNGEITVLIYNNGVITVLPVIYNNLWNDWWLTETVQWKEVLVSCVMISICPYSCSVTFAFAIFVITYCDINQSNYSGRFKDHPKNKTTPELRWSLIMLNGGPKDTGLIANWPLFHET